MVNLSTVFKNAKLELDKVIFPTKMQVKQAAIAVLLVVTIITIFLALVDMMMSAVVKFTI